MTVRNSFVQCGALLAVALLAITFIPSRLFAHCDGMDGPVVKAAQEALRTGDVDLVLVWVSSRDEGEIRQAFKHTLAVRKLSAEAQQLADTYFFETLVRIHRAGEGAAYTGLKPAGRDLGPAIPAADRAIQLGTVDQLLRVLEEPLQSGTRRYFDRVAALKNYSKQDVEEGRRYVKAYVEFIHYVERAYESTTLPVEGHMAESLEGTPREVR